MDLGPHAVFIWASYAFVVAGIGGLAAWIALDGRTLLRRLDELESRGIRRRSTSSPTTTPSKTNADGADPAP